MWGQYIKMKTKIIQFTAGRGPAECTWVVAKVLKVFLKLLSDTGIDYDILHKENGHQNGTVQSVTIRIRGKDLSFLNEWIGTIQWIGKSAFRKHHKRKNWYIGCSEIKDLPTLDIDTKDVKYQAIRSSGAGGQHVNKVSSAVRATHIPTGIQVLVMDSRSQHQNKQIAIQRLKDKVAVHNMTQLQLSAKNQWINHTSLERGNPVNTFRGTDFKNIRSQKSYKNTRQKLKNECRKERYEQRS